jgi:flagellar basal body rod protein FlgG
MDPLTTAAAAGMRARMDALDLLANNMANSSTPGYKADRESYNLYMSAEAAAEATGLSVRSPLVESQWIDLSQGALRSTGNSSDVAISGSGFLLAEGPNGVLLSRGGMLRVSSDGKLTTQDGYELVTVEDRRIKAEPGRPLEIDKAGVVRQEGAILGQLKLVEAPPASELARRDGVYMMLDTRRVGELKPASAEVRQGHVESSNTGPAVTAARLIGILRQFESLQKAIQIGGEMNRRAVEEVAKIHP